MMPSDLMKDRRTILIRFKSLLGQVEQFRHLNYKEQSELRFNLRTASVELENTLNEIQEIDRQSNRSES